MEKLKAIIERISAGKAAFRKELAQRPVEEKMAMPDALRDRALALRESGSHPPCHPRDEPRWYRQPENWNRLSVTLSEEISPESNRT